MLARRLGLFDAVMLVMGGIVGSGIFINPYVVAQQVHTPFLILGAWAAGGAIALAGAFVYAELAARRPEVGGQYAYLRDAFHPSVAFLYGWALLLVIQTGGMAAVAVTFARYFVELTHINLPDWAVAAVTLALLSVVNCLGVRAGSNVQSVLMVLKILAIAALVVCGLLFVSEPHALAAGPTLDRPVSLDLLTGMGAARLLRDGRGRRLLPRGRTARRAHPRARRRHRASGPSGRRHRRVGQVRADTQLRRLG